MEQNKLANAFLRAINKFSDNNRDFEISQDHAWKLADQLAKIATLTKNKKHEE